MPARVGLGKNRKTKSGSRTLFFFLFFFFLFFSFLFFSFSLVLFFFLDGGVVILYYYLIRTKLKRSILNFQLMINCIMRQDFEVEGN